MRKLNLRKARKLEKTIENRLGTSSTSRPQIIVSTSQSVEKVREMAQAYFTAEKDRVQTNLALLKLRFKIREMIGEQNHLSGINKLMVEKETLTANLSSYFPNAESCEAFNADSFVLKKEEALANLEHRGHESIMVGIFSEEDLKSIKETRYGFRQKLDEIEDQLNFLNLNSHITLTNEEVNLLRDQMIL